MQTALEFYDLIDDADKRLVHDASLFLHNLPDKGHPNSNGDHLWSCHAVCIAAQAIFRPKGWRVAHGHFGAKDHAWMFREKIVGRGAVVTTDNTILDLYPVASYGGPILVDVTHWSSPWTGLYLEHHRFRPAQVLTWHNDASTILGMVGHGGTPLER